MSCAINKGGFFKIAFAVDTHLPHFEVIAYVLPHANSRGGRCTTQSKSTELCSSSVAVVPQSKSTCTELCSPVAVVPHKVNLLSCVARRPFSVTQIKSTELCSSSAAVVPQSKSTELCSLGAIRCQPTLAPLKSLKSTYLTKLLKKLYWREHTHSTGGFDDLLETCERCRVSEPVFKHNSLCSSIHLKKCGLGSLISTQVKKTSQWMVSFYSKFQ